MIIEKVFVSVIVCSHNPNPFYLRRVIESLRAQSLPRHLWELLVIDNASAEPLFRTLDIGWHPGGRHLTEGRLGLTHARLRGIEASRGEILVFVDDDNVLNPDYLEVAHWIGQKWPMLGAWSGRIDPECETEPAEWCRRYLDLLAIRSPLWDMWSNVFDVWGAIPWGAGMCVRRKVALAYREAAVRDPRHLSLDRIGKVLSSCGDIDISMHAYDMGLGTGVFIDLRLRHLIPAERLTVDYLCRLVEAQNYSDTMLRHIHGKWPNSKIPFPILTLLRWLSASRERGPHRHIAYARIRGIVRAAREIAETTKRRAGV